MSLIHVPNFDRYLDPENPNTMISKLLPYCLLLALLTACQSKKSSENDAFALPYDLTKPTDRFELPTVLTKVSGLTYYKSGKLACVQAELGSVFFYDLTKRRLAVEQVFMPGGDYEGVEFANGRMYVLRSDGELFWVEPDETSVKMLGRVQPTHHIKIDLPGQNNVAGLGYDPKLDALLLAMNTSDRNGTDKLVYFYGLKTDALYAGPHLKQADIQTVDGSSTQEIKPSGLAVRPNSREYYWLASAAHRLIVTSSGGTVKSVISLDSTLFPKPEGICFAPDGTLFVANQGVSGTSYVLQFALKTAN